MWDHDWSPDAVISRRLAFGQPHSRIQFITYRFWLSFTDCFRFRARRWRCELEHRILRRRCFFPGWVCCGTINPGFWRNCPYQRGFSGVHLENTSSNLCHSLFVFSRSWRMRFQMRWRRVQGRPECNFKVKCGNKRKKGNSHLSSPGLFLFNN